MAVANETFRLNSQRITEVLGDPLFYHECVAYAFMRNMARERYVQHAAEVIRAKAKGCNGCDDNSKSIIDPALAAFIRHTVQLHDMDPKNLEPLATYLTGKLGYRPASFVLSYKENGDRKKLEF